MAWYSKPEWIEWDENETYTAKELEILADQFLREQADALDPETGKRVGIRATDNLPAILFESHLRERRRREIQSAEGVVDPAYTRDPKYPDQIPLYNRIHPTGGRKVNSESARRNSGASFYS